MRCCLLHPNGVIPPWWERNVRYLFLKTARGQQRIAVVVNDCIMYWATMYGYVPCRKKSHGWFGVLSFFPPCYSSLALRWCGGRICLHPHPTYSHHSFCTHLEQKLVSVGYIVNFWAVTEQTYYSRIQGCLYYIEPCFCVATQYSTVLSTSSE